MKINKGKSIEALKFLEEMLATNSSLNDQLYDDNFDFESMRKITTFIFFMKK